MGKYFNDTHAPDGRITHAYRRGAANLVRIQYTFLQWFAVVLTLIYHDLRHHMVKMLWTHEAPASESATHFDHVMT